MEIEFLWEKPVKDFSFAPETNLYNGDEQSYCVSARQDGLFYGEEFLQCFFKKRGGKYEIKSYLQDGDCVFKGQTIFQIQIKGKLQEEEELLSAISYLSGAYTLISCWTEKAFDFSIKALPTPDCFLSPWEKQAILNAGAEIQKPPEKIYFQAKEVEQALQMEEKHLVVSSSKISFKEIKNILQSLPPSIEIGLEGDFSPSDLEEFRDFPLQAVWPRHLQGFFPRLKMSIKPNFLSS